MKDVRSSLNTAFQGSIDEMKAEAETMIATAKAEGEEIKRKGAEQVGRHKPLSTSKYN